MGENIKEFAKKVVESIKKIFTPSEEIKDQKENPQEKPDSTTVNQPIQPDPLIGPSGF
jgi:hypothetical protein